MLEFLILGPVEIRSGDVTVRVTGAFQRALLVTLLVNDGRLVPTDSLMNELWGDDVPSRADNALQAHVSRLRRKLESIQQHGRPARLLTWPSGYQLACEEDALDARVFLRRLRDVEARAHEDPLLAVRHLRETRSMWRGAPFGGPVGGPICHGAAARYEESRSALLEFLFEHELRTGRHFEIIAELRQSLDSELLNERLCEQLMLALYRSGRQTDALDVYRRMRVRLAEQVGIEPSPTLRGLQRAILTQDPGLAPRADRLVLRG